MLWHTMFRMRNKRFCVAAKDGHVNLLKSEIDTITKMCNQYNIAIPDDWDWKWTVYGGKWRGKLTRRIESLFHANSKAVPGTMNSLLYGISLRVGHLEPVQFVDWTFQIRWQAGSFGDDRSCYFPYYHDGGRVSQMMDAGVGAFRVYKTDYFNPRRAAKNPEKVSGKARAWMIVDWPIQNCVTLYNAYGMNIVPQAYLLASVLRYLTKKRYDLVKRSIGGRAGRVPAYINGDGIVVIPKVLADKDKRKVTEDDRIEI